MEHKITTHITKGVVIGCVMVTLGFTFQLMDIYDKWVQWVTMGIYFAALIWSCFYFSQQMNAEVSFGQVFSHGFKTAAIVTLISIASFVITYFLFPEIKEKAMEMARQEMAKDERLTQEMIDQAISWTDKFYLVFGIIGSLFGFALTGAIASLIGAAVAKKKPNQNMPQSL
jgi:TRAP-type C4-dicarboxylate transport system permease large subunit